MEQKNQLITIPGAIIIGCTILAIAYFMTQRSNNPAPTNGTPQIPTVTMAPISANEHILGNPNAKIKIVEYSDPSCPYCKMFHPTMEQVMNAYGASGKVAWVYRQFPLDKPDANGNILHPNAGHEAQAFECAASIGGNDKFWAYTKEWYNVFPLQGATDRPVAEDTAQLASIAKKVGLNAISFSDCLASGQFKSKVEAQYLDGVNAGVSGTPYNIIITPSGAKIPLAGAVSYSTLKNTIDTLLGDVSSK
ncbi:MAG: thioredoxin domain-containing protein [Candidatus Pacebacteria bacterium]|nr:thioredoxin domain-containing protein [Candidatus Paceibacterota bacterium]